jgi:alpha-N-acetylglucosamine transferase
MKIKATTRRGRIFQYLGLARMASLFTEGFAAAGGAGEKLRLPDLFSRKSAKEFYSSVRRLNNATAASFTPSPTF